MMNFTNFENGKYMQETLKRIETKKNGAYFKIQYTSDLSSKIAASHKGNKVTKITTVSVRKGINYSHMKSVQAKRNSADYVPSTRQSWYHKVEGHTALLKHNSKEQYYVALFPNINGRPTSQFFLNGKPISAEELKNRGVMQPSYWNNNSKPEMITLALENVINVF